MPLVASTPVHVTRNGSAPALTVPPLRNGAAMPLAIGFTVSSTIVSVLGADQWPSVSRHFAQTFRVPFVDARIHGCDGAYARVVQVVPSFESATCVTPLG